MSANRNTLCLIVMLSVVSALASGASAVEIKLRERVVPKSSVVRLGDVAEITWADKAKAKQLAAVPLMPAPAPETERYLQKREIADMLAASGVDMGEVRFGGAEKVSIGALGAVQQAAFTEAANAGSSAERTRREAILAGANAPATAAAVIDEARAEAIKTQLCRIIGDFVKTKSGRTTGRIECSVTDRQLATLATAKSAPVCDGGSEPWTGRQKFLVSFATPAGPAQVPVIADVAEAAVPAVVAIRPVARGNVVTAADVELRQVEPSAKTGQRAVVESVEKIVGMEAKQGLQAGEVVFTDQVALPVLVKRGELVTISSQSSGIRVRTSARALQDGANGGLIQVESLQSKQRFDARIVGLREATVFARTRISSPEQPERDQTARRPLNSTK